LYIFGGIELGQGEFNDFNFLDMTRPVFKWFPGEIKGYIPSNLK